MLDAICEVSPRTRPMIDVQRVTLAQAGCVLCCRTGRQSGAAPGELRTTKLFTLPGSQSGRPHGKPPGWSGGRRVRGEPRTQPLLGSLPKRQGRGRAEDCQIWLVSVASKLYAWPSVAWYPALGRCGPRDSANAGVAAVPAGQRRPALGLGIV